MKRFSFSGKYAKRAHIDLTPLVDLVFLLVIFFMVSSTIGIQSAIHLNLPLAEKTTLAQDSAFIISVDESNAIYFNDTPVSAENLISTISEKKETLLQKKILIRGDKQANYETIILIMDSLNKSGISSFTLSTAKK